MDKKYSAWQQATWNQTSPISVCPFHNSWKPFIEKPDRMTLPEIESQLIQLFTMISDFNESSGNEFDQPTYIALMNKEKDIMHNTYLHMFNEILELWYEKSIDNIKSELTYDEVNKIVSCDTSMLKHKVIEKLFSYTGQLSQRHIDESEFDEEKKKTEEMYDMYFKQMRKDWLRKLGNGRWESLYAGSLIGFDMMVQTVRTYLVLWPHKENKWYTIKQWDRFHIPKHIFVDWSITQMYSYLLNTVAKKEFVENNPTLPVYDDANRHWYNQWLRDLFVQKIPTFAFDDFYQTQADNTDQRNLVYPLEKNAPCPARQFFSKMRPMTIGLILQVLKEEAIATK